jgi:signal transduction histidine kinase
MPGTGSVAPLLDAGPEPRADILAVDDNPANLLAIEAALRDLCGEVVQARSGEEALRLLLARDFAVILLDVKMPSLSGFDTARLIRERKRSRHTPIIFITAHGRDDQDVVAAYRLGAVDFLFKPVAAEVLRAKAAVFVELQRRAGELERQARLLERHEQARNLEEQRRRWNDEAVQRRIEELAEVNRHKDEFLAILGHELRNPLAPIVAGLEILRRKLSGDGVDDVVSRTRETLERQVEHLCRLVGDLLDVSRINSGKIELRKAPVAIQTVLRQAATTSEPAIQVRRHRLSLELPSEPLTVDGDTVRLTQVFANLLNNAAQYTDDGGQITVGCTRVENWVEVRVVDSGRGVGADLAPRIFDMFAQARRGEGLGLGLTIVKRLTEMHGGSVSVSSAGASRGSEFVVRLPVDTSSLATDALSQGAAPAVAAARTPVTRPLVIALIDDNPDVRQTTQDLLEEMGHTVEVAGDGEMGAALILRLQPDVALVDIGMPIMDGHGVAARVRAQPTGARVRLVAMSGYGAESDRRRSREAGFDHHLVKPCDMTMLMKMLSSEEIA